MRKYVIIFIVGFFLTSVNAGPFGDLKKGLEKMEKELKGITIDEKENKTQKENKNQIQKVTDGNQNSTSIELPLDEPGVAFECTLNRVCEYMSGDISWEDKKSGEFEKGQCYTAKELSNVSNTDFPSNDESVLNHVVAGKHSTDIGDFKTYFTLNLDDSYAKYFQNKSTSEGQSPDDLRSNYGIKLGTENHMSTVVLGDNYPGSWVTTTMKESNVYNPFFIYENFVVWKVKPRPHDEKATYSQRIINRENLALTEADYMGTWEGSCQVLSIDELNTSLKEEMRIKTDELASRANEITKNKESELSKERSKRKF